MTVAPVEREGSVLLFSEGFVGKTSFFLRTNQCLRCSQKIAQFKSPSKSNDSRHERS